MIELTGKYSKDCKIFADKVEESVVSQVMGVLNHPAFENVSVRIMPDFHAGAGCVIGFTAKVSDKIIPNLIGVDIGCFTGDTKVALLSGENKSLVELVSEGKDVWIYSVDSNKRIVPALAKPVKTKVDAELFEILISGGEKIRCTPDHKFMLLDGTYKEAKDLKEFDSLMPLYRTYQSRDGYEYVSNSSVKGSLTHVMVVEYIHGKQEGKVIHHKNGRWYDNTPENLMYLTPEEHSKLHIDNKNIFSIEEFKKKRIKTLKHKGFFSKEKLPIKVEVGLACNHKVLSTRKLDYKEDVYCLQVPDHNNFALASGIFVHNCGMSSFNFKTSIDSKDLSIKLDEIINQKIPSGCRVHQKEVEIREEFLDKITDICTRTKQDVSYVLKSIGTLGGGNHFIECGKLDDEHYLTVHSGSRNFGLKIALHHQKIAQEKNPSFGKELAWLEGDDAKQYLNDMRVAQEFASFNRFMMLSNIKSSLNLIGKTIESIHNFIGDDNVIRKGAISAKKDEIVIIPWNMRDGLIIGKGKGNSDWNNSAPHGAGRVLSRRKAKENVTLEEYQKSMEGIYTTCVNTSTLDESPMAYKPHEEVEQYLSESVEIIHRVKPFYNFKASE